jgi:hypothetical protein
VWLSLRAATRVASGRSLKRHSPKVGAEFTVATELRKSFIPRSSPDSKIKKLQIRKSHFKLY